ncbi:MAG: copper chaperone PCu(A)C [Gammaproteobacteria bacterium]|nr:copper chaperone PCu(A)C [Gammaproteobacteria bacterium]
MRNFNLLQRLLFYPALAALLYACSAEPAREIRVENGWIAEIPPMIAVTAALMTLHNDSDSARYLIEASSPRAERIEVHRSFVVNELARMERQSEVEVPAGGSVEFSNETGYHLMFYGTSAIHAGERIPVELRFRNGTVLHVEFEVRDRRKMG